QSKDHTDSVQRLVAIIQDTEEPMRLEAVGKGFSLQQFLIILSSIAQHALPIGKLSPLLVGLAPAIFQQALHQLNFEQLSVLKQESLTEPLQHQLTLFIHALERVCQVQESVILQIGQKVSELGQTEDLTHSTINQIENRIDTLKKFGDEILQAIDQAQAITWNTNRLDLIANLNQLKERFHHQVLHQIGSKSSEDYLATGLFANLEKFLFGAFGLSQGSKQANDALKDEDAAIEGLAKFSIWYLPDYWEVGLLPTIPNPEKLELDPSMHSEKERFDHRQLLFSLVQQNLDKLSLTTVGDLKKFKIFSKRMLKDFIVQNQNLLS
ncbi:MAG: hypothetical protein ACHQUC_10110, partial [Chlamydiales bacterium]